MVSSSSGDHLRPDRRVTGRGVGVEADHEPVVGQVGVEADFLDLKVVRNGSVAALAGQCGVGFRGATAQFLPEDVVTAGLLQVAAVGRRGEPAVGDPHDPGQGPVPHVVLDLPDQGAVGRLPGQAQHLTGIPSRVTAIPTTICGRSGRESLDLPKVRNPVSRTTSSPSLSTTWPRSSGRPGCRRPRSRSRWRWCRRTAGRLPGSAESRCCRRRSARASGSASISQSIAR